MSDKPTCKECGQPAQVMNSGASIAEVGAVWICVYPCNRVLSAEEVRAWMDEGSKGK